MLHENGQDEVRVCHFYEAARAKVIRSGYMRELDWVEDLQARTYREVDLLRECAWVILCSGFRESVVRRVFNYVSLCFCDWVSAELITTRRALCEQSALVAFRNTRKISAIGDIAAQIAAEGFDQVKKRIDCAPLAVLKEWPYIGAITAQHLAKNLGYSFAKSDRHLLRIADRFGFADAQSLCQVVAERTGHSIAAVDSVFWRYAVLSGSTPT